MTEKKNEIPPAEASTPSVMGHDPLAWISAGDDGEGQVRNKAEDSVSAEVIIAEEDTEPKAVGSNGDSNTIVFSGDLGIAQVEAEHKRLVEFVAVDGKVVLDIGSLIQVDSSGIQMLHAFVLDITKKGVEIAWKGESESLVTTATLLGLHEKMQLSTHN
ncbi:MAG: STAS domain-containing protein [Mariprofundaceae bacterium]